VLSLPALLIAQDTSQDQESKQLTELRQEVDSLEQGQKKIQKDLSAVMDILSGKRPPLENVFVTVANSPSLGRTDAKVTVVEFTDFQCPFCGAYARDTFAKMLTDQIKTGNIRYVVRNFPLEQSHPLARKAAEASLCADEQGKFWALHDRFFADQKKLSPEDIPEHVIAIGADLTAFQQCFSSSKYAAKVAADVAEGRDLQVGATPTFFIGYSDPDDPSRVRALRTIVGNAPYREFQKMITEASQASKQATEEK
jgi:protein-disulfide isomerase